MDKGFIYNLRDSYIPYTPRQRCSTYIYGLPTFNVSQYGHILVIKKEIIGMRTC